MRKLSKEEMQAVLDKNNPFGSTILNSNTVRTDVICGRCKIAYQTSYGSLKSNKFKICPKGHFRPIRFNGIDQERANSLFERTLKRDSIKNQYCEENNIFLLRISYEQINSGEYKKILSSIFTEM